jgi:NADPH:quinone reductase-like Zn-dependent oxidoreductase
MIVGRARVAPGDRVLVQSGAGGVASMAIQVAELVGARVAATASTEAKRALCLELGAEVAFAHDDALAGVKAWSPGGVDHVVEHVGGETFERSLRMVRWGGTVVTCGATTGHEVPLNLRVLFFKQLSLLGSTMGSFGELQAAWRAVEARRVRAVVDRVVPVRDIADAHRAIEAREVSGKVVVQVAGGW